MVYVEGLPELCMGAPCMTACMVVSLPETQYGFDNLAHVRYRWAGKY